MPRTSKGPWCCPSCGYQVGRSSAMRKHLYDTKQQCPRVLRDIELTEEIKQYILRNRVWHPPPKQRRQPAQQNIYQTFNQINNFVNTIDSFEKLQLIMQHNNKDIETVDFAQNVRREFQDQVLLIKGNAARARDEESGDMPCFRSWRECIQQIDRACNGEDSRDMCVMIDGQRLNIVQEGQVSGFVLDVGMQIILEIVQDVYLNQYEIFLIRGIESTPNHLEKQIIREKLDVYFKFLSALERTPYVNKARYDTEIAPNERNPDSTADEKLQEYRTRFDKIQVADRERRDIRKQLAEVVKSSAKRNEDEINKAVLELLRIDDKFMDTFCTKYNVKAPGRM